MTALPDVIAKARTYAARDIIDDIAGAICKAGGRSWHRAPKARRDRYRAMARASLETIRIADPAIIAATAYLADSPTLADFQIAAGAAACCRRQATPTRETCSLISRGTGACRSKGFWHDAR